LGADDRIFERLEQLYRIGGGHGANRIGYSAEEQEAHDLCAGWMREAGLEVESDGAGNLFGHVPSAPGARRVWSGSHLDSVPSGGRFDGALGVVAALEAAERLRSPGLSVVAFREEERGCVGSRACAVGGELPDAYLELHIEQGPVLEHAGAPLAVVSGIVGYVRGELVVEGRAGHAGTTPMEGRADALVEASELILRIRDTARAIEGAVATVGRVEVAPGGINVIPGRVRISVDARAPDRKRLDRLVGALGLDPEQVVDPTTMAAEPRAVLRAAIEERGLPVIELASGAGHDAGVLARAGVQSGMLFVRSLNGGISHSPDEHSSREDVVLAVDVLTDALRRLLA
jgi:acetylornithine deacetylase/succinyl-diaminopimelate desuccinylase-like protein